METTTIPDNEYQLEHEQALPQRELDYSKFAYETIISYPEKNVCEFRDLRVLRQKVRCDNHSRRSTIADDRGNRFGKNCYADVYFQQQREAADTANKKKVKYFYYMMQGIGRELQEATEVFDLSGLPVFRPKILDLYMAHGGFLSVALQFNPRALAHGFSLPASSGGHKLLMPRTPNLTANFLDISMLAADMGADSIPDDHPDALNFLPRCLAPTERFDLVLCDGQVLRLHERAAYRERREACRLIVTQLALGLERLREGGSMVVLLHRVESWNTLCLLYIFNQFSTIRLFKPRAAHAKKSSFYMIATQIHSRHPQALRAIQTWKTNWHIATFGTDEEYGRLLRADELLPERALEEFGRDLARLGTPIWKTQLDALTEFANAELATRQSR